ncbi:MAG TPA: V-type ATPase subunit [Candidatus Dorea intestinavium]|nr:V-type ATPase subunit [Candidatus Dorea intestinavium]
MSGVMTYSGITTKIKAMEAKLLTDKDYETIAGMHGVVEVIEFLKGKPGYSRFIEQLDDSLYHRRHIEKVLVQSLYDDYTRVFRFAGFEQKKFMKFYIKGYEVDLINYCFRIVFNHYDWPFDLDYKKEFFDTYSQLSIEKLETSTNIEELVENLKGTEYYEPLKRVAQSPKATLFDYDLALDLYSFTNLWKMRKRTLKNKELEYLTKDIGTVIDLMNLQWIYRAKKYYKLVAPDIYSMTIPIQYHLKVDEFKALVEAPGVEEFVNQVANTYYAKKYHLDNTKTLEQLYKDSMVGLYMADRRRAPYSIASINTYFFLKENEIDKLTTALECIRYGLSSRETLGYIGGVIH